MTALAIEVQTTDIIFVNLWQILISLANLVIIFLVVKKFLFKPIKKVMDSRQNEIESQYAYAEQAMSDARASKAEWEEKRQNAKAEADEILQNAADNAKYRGEKILEEARERADGIVRQAEIEADLERKRATADIKREIVEVSGALAERMIGREINTDDHRALIDSFIDELGDDYDANR